ncbi:MULTISPECIES: tripartite tricarboxylate transporter substrate-binding protein [unclassified Aminobacter]|uniref:Bug family tripartite tricarboxylate transporter substrate binding protein n=1 Tax=unclassified Aminobacter TaxID=2644704 RepID=UPI0004646100|nr:MULTISPECIES: tripartite tricarboxylate transporter substrate-binding protein [unclassified Aminobacter]TWG55119.1 tripartite-type tricarboxylate transporter receptor subunit TctC [Aminobacter sp. J44]TWH28832.1 tripartite-type tricarboxylate transporter receptor subunit TctC [Aminobacter sp. J15]
MIQSLSFTRRALMGAALALTALAGSAAAQDKYPSGPVTIVVPFAAGGTTDAIARLVAEELQTRWGSAVVVENKPGAGGVIATQAVARSKPDGTQILFNDIGIALNEVTMPSLPYNLKEDLRPVVTVGEWPLAFLAGSNTGIKTMSELVERAKNESLALGTFGPASSPHLAGELLKSVAGIDIKIVHFKGVSPVIQAMAAGEVQLGVFGVGAAAGEVAKGTMNVLAVDYKSPLMPEAPTFAEAGVDGLRAIAWWGVFVQSQTPDEIVNEINAGVNEALTSERVVKYLDTNGYTKVGGDGAALQQRVDDAVSLWGPLAEKAGIVSK